MNSMKTALASSFACLLLAGTSWMAHADDNSLLEQQSKEMDKLSMKSPTVAEQKVASSFEALAGSEDNAKRLVSGLRAGNEVKLLWIDADGKEVTTTLAPETGKMGLGNVFIAMALAQESLKKDSVENPNPEDFAKSLAGILDQRADGGGWGKIAKDMGMKLGPVVAAIRSENGRMRANDHSSGVASKGSERSAKGAERAAKVERSDRPGRPDRPGKPERATKG